MRITIQLQVTRRDTRVEQKFKIIQQPSRKYKLGSWFGLGSWYKRKLKTMRAFGIVRKRIKSSQYELRTL